jgi:hypothetical protein
MIIQPRQARDKHRESSKTRVAFLQDLPTAGPATGFKWNNGTANVTSTFRYNISGPDSFTLCVPPLFSPLSTNSLSSRARKILFLKLSDTPPAAAVAYVLRENGTFFEFSLCLSRACLGKILHLIYKWLKKCRLDTT